MGTTKARFIELHGEEAWEKEAERRSEHKKQYYQTNREIILLSKKQYQQEHKKEIAKRKKEHRQRNKEKINEHNKQYYQTLLGRAVRLCGCYYREDKKNERGECTLTPEWLIDNIFNSQCVYCGDDDWQHLGADRINNDLPHTPENCICSCGVCNIERQDKYTVEEFKEYRSLHPRVLGDKPEKNWEIAELPSGLKVIKKKTTNPTCLSDGVPTCME